MACQPARSARSFRHAQAELQPRGRASLTLWTFSGTLAASRLRPAAMDQKRSWSLDPATASLPGRCGTHCHELPHFLPIESCSVLSDHYGWRDVTVSHLHYRSPVANPPLPLSHPNIVTDSGPLRNQNLPLRTTSIPLVQEVSRLGERSQLCRWCRNRHWPSRWQTMFRLKRMAG